MQQTVIADYVSNEPNAVRLKYGGGPKIIFMAGVFAIAMLYAYEPFTSGRVEWHLFLKTLPAIPNQIMIGLWWVCMAMSVGVLILSIMPAVKVIVDDEKIIAQSIYTRSFKTVLYKDILDVVYHKNYLNITDRHNNKIYLAKLMMKGSAFRYVCDKVRALAVNAI